MDDQRRYREGLLVGEATDLALKGVLGAPPVGVSFGSSTLAIYDRKVILPVAAALAVLVLWEALVRALKISPVLLPPPSMIGQRLVELFFPLLLRHSIPTAWESILAFLI